MNRIWIGLICGLLLGSTVLAQADSSKSLQVSTNPPGALVKVEGDVQATGITPVSFRFPMVGAYKLTIKKKGYEKYSTDMVLDPAVPVRLDVDLVAKTGFKAAVRSMFVPGWGQAYTGQKTKGFTFALLFGGSIAAFLIADNRFNDKEDAFTKSKDAYAKAFASGVSAIELDRLWVARNDAQSDAFDAETVRRISIGAVAGIWGLNVLDALLFTNTEDGNLTIQGVGINPSTDGQTVSLSLTKAF